MTKNAILLGLTLAIGCTGALAEDQSDYEANPKPYNRSDTSGDSDRMRDSEGRDADNTGLNKRDKGGANPTAQTQSNSSKDVNLLAEVRRAVVDNDSLSVTARNIKIMVEDGVVMLRGPVESEVEKAKIGSLAKGVKGVTRVDNQLDIKKP